MPAPAASPRLFLALWPDDAARQALARSRDRWAWPPGATPVRTEQLHMTLHFLGLVAGERIHPLCTALARTAPADDFTLEFGSARLWPNGIAVTCPLSTPAALLQLHARLGEALRSVGLPVEERAFRAHVTLARRAHRAVLPAEGPAEQWDVRNGFALVQSMAGGQGYRVLQQFG